MSRVLTVVRSGPLTTVQDRGRFGHRAAGVSPSGAADLGALARANRLVGNPAGTAVLEATLGGLVLIASSAVTMAVAGAVCPGVVMDTPLRVEPGGRIALGRPSSGLRAYLAVAGGIAATPVLGSRSTDTLGRLGPAPLRDGDEVLVGRVEPAVEHPGAASAPSSDTEQPFTILPGPRDDWLDSDGWTALLAGWTVASDSDRTAVRLRGTPVSIRPGSLPPEPVVRGAVQLPPDGLPIVFLADHPVTGGYPVVGVLDARSCDRLAQRRPGQTVTLAVSGGSAPPSR